MILLLSLMIAVETGAETAAGEPWWVPLGLRGSSVTAVWVDAQGELAARVGGATLRSHDGGRSFQSGAPAPAGTRSGGCARGSECTTARAEGGSWRVSSGRVVMIEPGGRLIPDPQSPDLGAGAALIAAPPRRGAGVVAVAGDGTVWYRRADGSWGRSLLLLPRNPFGGVPPITSIAAFPAPVSEAVYLGVDGYAVLITNNGGEDWVRAGPGLPEGVLSLAADAPMRSVYAGTTDGLWVHHVQPFPSPPDYADQALWLRWLGVALIALMATSAALGALSWDQAERLKRCSMSG